MSPMDPRARVGDAEREETVTALERYARDGYLSLDEFSERSAAAYRATTYGELAKLTDDLTRAEPERSRGASKLTRPGSWSPAAIVVAAVVGVVLVAAIVIAMMMIGMMGSMGGMMEDMR